MLVIHCPNCGPRHVEEFRFGGEIPDPPAHIVDPVERDFDQSWMFNNVNGVQTERWFHEAGCHRWLTTTRSTTDDRLVAPD